MKMQNDTKGRNKKKTCKNEQETSQFISDMEFCSIYYKMQLNVFGLLYLIGINGDDSFLD